MDFSVGNSFELPGIFEITNSREIFRLVSYGKHTKKGIANSHNTRITAHCYFNDFPDIVIIATLTSCIEIGFIRMSNIM